MELQRASHEAELERQAAIKINEAREIATREHDRIIAEAREKAHKFVEAGEDKARRAYEQSMSESREAIITLGLGGGFQYR
jgi:vacuolar-type H+-ATPase subunit H